MDNHNILPPLDFAFYKLVGFSFQDNTTEPQLRYQGMSVQELHTPCSAYFSQSNANQNNAHPINPLDEFCVAPLLDPVPGSYLCNQSCFSEDEADISVPKPANRLNLNHHLTNLPAELAYPQDSRPVAAVNPLNMQQAASNNPVNSAKIVANKSSQAKLKMEREGNRYQNDPAYAENQKERQRKRYQNDPAYAESQKERQRKRRQNDPIYAESQRIYLNNYRRMKKKYGTKEAARLASVARAKYLQSVNSSKDSGDLPQNSNKKTNKKTKKQTNKKTGHP